MISVSRSAGCGAASASTTYETWSEHRAQHHVEAGFGLAESSDRASAAASDQSTSDAVCSKEANS
jgi:hypothetical protein